MNDSSSLENPHPSASSGQAFSPKGRARNGAPGASVASAESTVELCSTGQPRAAVPTLLLDDSIYATVPTWDCGYVS